MGFDIPEPYCWDESFRVFYDQIDDEHKGLFQGIFNCTKTNDAATLAKLVQAVKDHFTYEEGMMQKANYSEFAVHKPLHTDFISKIDALKAPLNADQVHFAKEWLVNHIKGTDFKYKGKL
jgi:hemerythrin